MGKYDFDPSKYEIALLKIIENIQQADEFNYGVLRKILTKYPKDGSGFFSKDEIIAGYRYLLDQGLLTKDPGLLERVRMKPTRTISGIAAVTVLTKPFPCPGQCIFCPNDVKMPKSYLSDEPGAQRAERNSFDPYLQTYNRLLALKNIGHSTDKVELIILGGTWSFYPEDYQIWFVKQCFEAMNDFQVRDRRHDIKVENMFEEADKVPVNTDSGRRRSYNEIIDIVEKEQGKSLLSKTESATWEELFASHEANVSARSRCVGLVIETRPDYIDEDEVIRVRKLGATKVQIGIQSLDDKVMNANMRGHGRAETESAIALLRRAGFKIHAHWMPNLHGSSVENDISDYDRLWEPSINPDELKVYPTSIIENTGLHDLYKSGRYQPYSYSELLKVLTSVMPKTPRFCRLTRVVRDIPSTDIVAGNKLTNFRQIAEEELNRKGEPCQCIRCREIKARSVTYEELELETIEYETLVSKEYFISYKTADDDRICGFLRLSLPNEEFAKDHFIAELQGRAIIREVHVYGQVVDIGKSKDGRSQHLGLGTKMIQEAESIALNSGFNKISVISAVGTREYYEKRGYQEKILYQHKTIS